MSTLHPGRDRGDEPALRPGRVLAAGLALLAVTAALLWTLGGARAEDADGGSHPARPRVVTTVTMLTDVARRLAGEDLVVDGLMQPGVDPHVWRPTRHDVVRLLEADLVALVDLHLEAELLPALNRMERSGVEVWRASGVLPHADLLAADDEEPGATAAHDPHVWMDPELFGHAIDGLAAALSELAPDAAGRIEARRAALEVEWRALDAFAAASFASVPRERRVLVTAHDAFGYFGRRYGPEVLGLQGLSTESEAGLARVESLIDTLVDGQIPAVFNESTVASRGVASLIEGARASGHEVALGGHLYADATGPVGTPEGTWLGMLEHDVRTIVAALGGRTVPLGTPPAVADARGAIEDAAGSEASRERDARAPAAALR